MKLAGRQDFPLATLAKQRTSLIYEQSIGPTEVVRLNDGLVVVETSPGARRVRLGLPAGSYLVRRRTANGVFVRIVSLSAGSATSLAESDLERSTLAGGRTKDVEHLAVDGASWAGQRFFASLALGVRHAPVIDPGLRAGDANGRGVALLRVSVHIAQHVWWSAPLSVVFDAERPTAFNWFAWAGVPVLSGSHPEGRSYLLNGFLGAGFDARLRASERHTFNASLSELGAFEWAHRSPKTWSTQLTLGLSETIPDAVTFNFGVATSANLLVNGHFESLAIDAPARDAVFAFGSVQRAGLRPLPLIHVPLGRGGASTPTRWVRTCLHCKAGSRLTWPVSASSIDRRAAETQSQYAVAKSKRKVPSPRAANRPSGAKPMRVFSEPLWITNGGEYRR